MCLCLRGEGEGGLQALCLEEEVRGGGGGDRDGDLRLFLSQRSLVGDLREDPLHEEKEGDGVRRMRGGDGVTGTRFLYGDLDLRLERGDLLRDLKIRIVLEFIFPQDREISVTLKLFLSINL